METSGIFVLLNIFKLRNGVFADEDMIMTLRNVLAVEFAAKTGGRVVQQSFAITVEELYWLLCSQVMVEKLAGNAYDLSDGVRGLVSGTPETHFLQFEAFPKGATSDAPVSEVVVVTHKKEVDIDAFMAYQDTITEAMKKEPAFMGIARSVPDRKARTLWVFVVRESKEAEANGDLLQRFGDSMYPKSGGMAHVPCTEV